MSHHGGVPGYLLSGVELASVYVLKDLELTEKLMKTLHFYSTTTAYNLHFIPLTDQY